ncbi:17063_t:CDS:2, partial [Racocetra persica]
TRHFTKEIIIKYIKLCFPFKKLTSKSIFVLKGATHTTYRSYRDALRTGLEEIARSDINNYLQEGVWRPFLRYFFEAIDEETIFILEFKKVWQMFMSECLIKLIEEILNNENKLVKITDLDYLTLDYDIYDASNILDLNDKDFKALLKKELGNKNKKNRD